MNGKTILRAMMASPAEVRELHRRHKRGLPLPSPAPFPWGVLAVVTVIGFLVMFAFVGLNRGGHLL